MKEECVRAIFYYKNFYLDFFKTLDEDTRLKFNWVLKLIATIDRVPVKYLKHIEGSNSLYEIRIEHNSNIYRVFCFFDKGNLIILLNGFKKKKQKTPKNEIKLAERLKVEYYDEKLK